MLTFYSHYEPDLKSAEVSEGIPDISHFPAVFQSLLTFSNFLKHVKLNIQTSILGTQWLFLNCPQCFITNYKLV